MNGKKKISISNIQPLLIMFFSFGYIIVAIRFFSLFSRLILIGILLILLYDAYGQWWFGSIGGRSIDARGWGWQTPYSKKLPGVLFREDSPLRDRWAVWIMLILIFILMIVWGFFRQYFLEFFV